MIKKENNILSFIVDAESSGQRIDRFLTCKIKDESRSYIQSIISDSKVKVNGQIVSKNYRIAEKDIITVEFTGKRDSNSVIKPQKINLKIVYEDSYLLVISKEPGMLTHPVPGSDKDTVVNALLYHCDTLSDLYGRDRAGIVHRLDKDTSGLMIVAKNNNIHQLLSEKFKNREIKKTYSALVLGRFMEKRGEIIMPVGRSRLDRKKMCVSIDTGRNAVTEFEVKEEFENMTLLDVYPETGRTHQIRVHLSYIGHPVIGDKVYGNSESKKMARELELKRQFLHAKRLEFNHPVTGKDVILEDELADDLLRCLKVLRGVDLR
ncbi:MAG: RluA family pseudouridine synthase [Candidatus Humimicrobiaceae bacterium]|nr:RluA family pseudouridine synthase [Actinomycetota bacterium]MDD5601129.1 RluA family pseudouridine synthase [Actinomycetota bacterium]MDY0027984.1 RluA family pseudouridine synthase [Candidatus Humimicrobiaceae bacterium]